MSDMVKIVLLMLTVFWAPPSAFAKDAEQPNQSRVAIVIGNDNYQFVPTLRNPKNDAVDVADALSKIGFNVETAFDVTQTELLRTLRVFRKRASKADIAIVYFAGHGIQIGKKSYIIPTDAILASDRDIPFEAITLDSVALATNGASTLGLVILDACRNNPFLSSMEMLEPKRSFQRGLALFEPAANTLVSFSARGGTTAMDGLGRNSPFAAALIDALNKPNVEIGLMFRIRDAVLEATNGKQEPFTYGSLSAKPLFLNENRSIEDSSIVQSESQISTTNAIVSSPSDMRNIQERLQILGLNPGPIDGIFGWRTKAAVERFQTTYKLEVSGSTDRKTLLKLHELVTEKQLTNFRNAKFQKTLHARRKKPSKTQEAARVEAPIKETVKDAPVTDEIEQSSNKIPFYMRPKRFPELESQDGRNRKSSASLANTTSSSNPSSSEAASGNSSPSSNDNCSGFGC